MTVHFSLSALAEAQLLQRAQASGITPDELARRLVEHAVTLPSQGPQLARDSTESRMKSFRTWAGSLTPDTPADDDREPIYSERGL